MKTHSLLVAALGYLIATAAVGQAQPSAPRQGPGVQSWQDAREPAVLAKCKTPPPPPPARPAATGPAPEESKPSASAAIPGVIAAGQQWKVVWTEEGNNADGIIASEDGGLLLAQNDKSDVVKLGPDGKAAVVYRDTNTGGALSRNSKGALFIVERALNPAVWELAPRRKVLANTYKGDPLDCLGGVINDLTADSKGGVYFTMGGVYYANPQGVVAQYGENLRTNGIILSPDEKTLYVTNGDTLAAFDVQPDGSLTHQREFAKLPSGRGDGSTVDAAGRIYVTAMSNIHVFAADGKFLGSIPAPSDVISVAFSGSDKKTLYAVIFSGGAGARGDQIMAIPMIAQGYMGRAK